MTKQFLLSITVTSLLLTACGNYLKTNDNTTNAETNIENKLTDIPYTVIKNYFVKNDFNQLDNPKIETEEKFNEVFGMAALMGENGMPTEIDFTKQYVIAVIKPTSEYDVILEPISLQRISKNDISLNYKYEVGANQSNMSRMFFAIIIDKTETGDISLIEVK